MFRLGHARGADWAEIAAESVAQLGDTAGATLGFIYLSDLLAPDAEAILERLRQDTGIEHWVGAVGLGVIATGREYVDEPALSVLVADFPAGELSVFSGRQRPPAPGTRTSSGASAAHLAIVHGDPRTEDMPALVEDMARKVESGFLVGGLASARGRPLVVADGVLEGGLSGVVLSSAISVTTRLTQGCAPLPQRHVITEAEGNVIAKLDGRPALDVLRADLGVPSGQLERAAQTIHAALPVPGSDIGDYVVRNLVGADPRRGLLAIGAEVEAGMPLMFARRDRDAARADLDRMLDAVLEAAPANPRGALYFSCVARGEHMFGARSAELEHVRARLGDVPLAGFFCNGEISHDRLYGYTGVLAVFS